MQDLLGKYRAQPPDEITAIKQYIADTFQASATVGLQNDSNIIMVSSAALANALRLRTTQLQAAAKTSKRLVFRIGEPRD